MEASMMHEKSRSGLMVCGKVAAFATALSMLGVCSSVEAKDYQPPKLKRQELVLLVTSAAYAEKKCTRYFVDAVGVQEMLHKSGLFEAIGQSQRDADFSLGKFKEFMDGDAEEICLKLYDLYGENGKITKNVLVRKY